MSDYLTFTVYISYIKCIDFKNNFISFFQQAKEKEERYLKRQQRRLELESKKKERDEEKARLKEEKKQKRDLLIQSEVQENDVPITGKYQCYF